MLSRANTFHGGSSSRFNLPPRDTCPTEPELIKLPPIKQSEASPQRAAGTNNELARLRAQQAVGGGSKLRFSETSLFPARREHKTAISVHPKFLDEPASSRFYYPGYSPYLMDCDSQERYFMSGYSGFVPRLRYLDGATFPVLTHDAMDEFDGARRAHAAAQGDTVPAVPGATSAWLPGRGRLRGRKGEAVIYRKCEGLVPNYQGHIPGHRRRFGRPFGPITVNARELP